jgi:hypothetical protein
MIQIGGNSIEIIYTISSPIHSIFQSSKIALILTAS